MSMPKGYKSTHGYFTVKDKGTGKNEGMGFKEISDMLSSEGDVVAPSTVRHLLVKGLMKISRPLVDLHFKDCKDPEDKSWEVASDPRFHDAIVEILKEKDFFKKVK